MATRKQAPKKKTPSASKTRRRTTTPVDPTSLNNRELIDYAHAHAGVDLLKLLAPPEQPRTIAEAVAGLDPDDWADKLLILYALTPITPDLIASKIDVSRATVWAWTNENTKRAKPPSGEKLTELAKVIGFAHLAKERGLRPAQAWYMEPVDFAEMIVDAHPTYWRECNGTHRRERSTADTPDSYCSTAFGADASESGQLPIAA